MQCFSLTRDHYTVTALLDPIPSYPSCQVHGARLHRTCIVFKTSIEITFNTLATGNNVLTSLSLLLLLSLTALVSQAVQVRQR